jgi:hypothetical protein
MPVTYTFIQKETRKAKAMEFDIVCDFIRSHFTHEDVRAYLFRFLFLKSLENSSNYSLLSRTNGLMIW